MCEYVGFASIILFLGIFFEYIYNTFRYVSQLQTMEAFLVSRRNIPTIKHFFFILFWICRNTVKKIKKLVEQMK